MSSPLIPRVTMRTIGAVIAAPPLAAALAVAALGAPTSASAAGTGPFCPNVENSKILINANDRCVTGRISNLTAVAAALKNRDGINQDGVMHCAVGKETASGGGSDVIPKACGTSSKQITNCYTARVGYPTIVNQSNSQHYYNGAFGYGGC